VVVQINGNGWDRLWALSSGLTMPLADERSPTQPRCQDGRGRSRRLPGRARRSDHGGKLWCRAASSAVVCLPDPVLAVDLAWQRYQRVVVEVKNPRDLFRRLSSLFLSGSRCMLALRSVEAGDGWSARW
jgi:hypothetical protein